MKRAYKKRPSENEELNQMQEDVGLVAEQLIRVPILDGNLITGVVLTSGIESMIAHKLNRESRGWIVVKKNANSNVWDVESTNTMKGKFIKLTCDANVTVDLWVF